MPDESFIQTRNGKATTFVGPDATRLYRATVIKHSIELHSRCGMLPTRGVSITKLFALATEYTGKAYRRHEHSRAIADLELWIVTMRAALPVIST